MNTGAGPLWLLLWSVFYGKGIREVREKRNDVVPEDELRQEVAAVQLHSPCQVAVDDSSSNYLLIINNRS